MVTNHHEIAHTLFEEDPNLVSRALRNAGLEFPDLVRVEELGTDLSTVDPVERRADYVMRFRTPDGLEAIAVIEAQRGKKTKKPSTWAYYGIVLASRYEVPVVIVVIATTVACERWARQSFDFGLGFGDRLTVKPLVLGPSNVKVVTDVEAARKDPIYAMLSVVVHRDRKEIGAILEAVGEALPEMPEDTQPVVINFVELVLEKSPLGNLWRNKVSLHPDMLLGPTMRGLVDEAIAEGKAKGRTEGRAEGRAEGEAMGEAKALIKLAVARGIALTPDERDRIMSCLDRQVLDVWFSRALTVPTAQEIFADEA